jgi:zinc-ribbon domain
MTRPSSNGRGAWLADVGARGGDGSLDYCRRCGTGLPDDANFCLRCGERIRSDAGSGASAAAGDECTIVWWRGYVRSGFYAVATGGHARSGEPLGTSLFRRLGGGAPVPEGRALEAHRALVERMQSEGWDRVGRGAHWYETRFHRTRGAHTVEDAAVDSSPGRSLAVPAPLPDAEAARSVPTTRWRRSTAQRR